MPLHGCMCQMAEGAELAESVTIIGGVPPAASFQEMVVEIHGVVNGGT